MAGYAYLQTASKWILLFTFALGTCEGCCVNWDFKGGKRTVPMHSVFLRTPRLTLSETVYHMSQLDLWSVISIPRNFISKLKYA